MQSRKFLANYKCECYGQDYCSCPHKDASNAVFMENIYDVADALAEIMGICGIHPCKAKASIDVIIYSFLHYDEIRHRIDAVPRKRLCKEDLIHDLGRKCLMNRMEAQLTYSIIKRAFKAFYHGTAEGGIRNPVLEAQLIHSQECMWVHAAKRTSQVFASYEGMFFSAQKHYESQIKCVYKRLYDRLQKRSSPVDIPECQCESCLRRAVYDCGKHKGGDDEEASEIQHETRNSDETPARRQQLSTTCERRSMQDVRTSKTDDEGLGSQRHDSKVSFHLPRCFKCNCPKLICDCDVERDSGVVTADCSQGPYKCQWVRLDDEEPEDTCIEVPEDHECPVDCDDMSGTCDPECECVCGDSCECVVEDNSSDYEATEEAGSEKGEEEQELTERSAYGGCCVMNHIVEEVMMAENPTSIAKVVGHKREASVKSEQVHYPKPHKASAIQKIPPLSSLTEDEKRKESEEIMKLIGQLI